MVPKQGFFESDKDYRDRVAREANERIIQDSTGSAPRQGIFEGNDSYRDRIAREASERILQDSTGSVPRQGFFEGNDQYGERIAREANKQAIRAARGSVPSQGLFESDSAYDTRVRREANESIIVNASGGAPRQRWFESDYEYRRRIAHEARESIVQRGRNYSDSQHVHRDAGHSSTSSVAPRSQVRPIPGRKPRRHWGMVCMIAALVGGIAFIVNEAYVRLPRAVYARGSQDQGYHLAWDMERERILYVSTDLGNHSTASVVGVDGSNLQKLDLQIPGGYTVDSPDWAPDGQRIAFTKRSFLTAQQSDRFKWTDSFGEVCVVDVDTGHTWRYAVGYDPAWSEDGQMIAYVTGPPLGDTLAVLQILPGNRVRTIKELPMTDDSSDSLTLGDPCWSPDGEEIAFLVGDAGHSGGSLGMSGSGSIWTLDVRDHTLRLLISGNLKSPVWSPDGERLAFRDSDDAEIYTVSSSSGEKTRITTNDLSEFCIDWTPDGQFIRFYVSGKGLYEVSANGGEASLICRSR
jgi:hypothetical protein